MRDITRRGFLKGVATASATGMAAVATGAGAQTAAASDETSAAQGAASTIDVDVAVVGLGAAGMLAAIGAADRGASVLAIDAATSFAGTTNCSTTGAWFVEGTAQKQEAYYISKKEAYEYVAMGTHQQSNGPLLRNIIEVSGRAADLLVDGGVPFQYAFSGVTQEQADAMFEKKDLLSLGGYLYTVSGQEREPFFQALLDSRPGIDARWGCKATAFLKDSDGAVNGLEYEDPDGAVVQVNAKAVISCGGGFIANDEMKRLYYGGSDFVCQGFPTVDGSSMRLCMDAGAQLGKNFSVSVNEMGGCNFKSTPQYSWFPGTDRGTNQALYLLLLGCMMVDASGGRFVSEESVVTNMMFTGEPLLRAGTYYVVLDEAMMERVRTTPLLDLFSDDAKSKLAPVLLMGFTGYTCETIDDDLATAISEGWACKADSVAELAEAFGLDELEETVTEYNEACASGDDELFYTDADYLHPIESGPFYAVQYNPGAWCTLGGIRTDKRCRALDKDNRPIPGLYVAGLDADLFGVPYYEGGSAQGFSYASGLLAGESATAQML